MKARIGEPDPNALDRHFSPQFHAEFWGISVSTIVQWFRDKPGELKIGKPSRNGQAHSKGQG